MLKQFIVLFLFSLKTFAFSYTADVFEQNSNYQKKLFTFKLVTTKSENGLDEHKGTFYDLDGKPVLEETALMHDYDLTRVDIDQKQSGRFAIIKQKGNEVTFEIKNADGKNETATEKIDGTLVVAATLQRYVKHIWPQLMDGKTVDFRFAVWERKETVGFSLKKVKEETVRGEKAVVLKMTASSFVIRQLVDPIYFKFTTDGSKLLESNGRVAVKRMDGKKVKDLDADVIYSNYQD